MKQIDLKEVHRILMDTAKKIDEICERHNIPLFMISGTMLGAVRHKGFIPWDDDMDFAVPYEHYHELIQILCAELPSNLRCLIFDTSETYRIPWIKVEDAETIVFDKSLDLPENKMPGLTIDIFPLVSCEREECDKIVKKIQKLLTIQRVAYSLSTANNSKWKNVLKKTIRLFMPLSPMEINGRIMNLMGGIAAGSFYTIPVDPNYYSRYFPQKWFSPLTKYKFEDSEFYGVADYDSYLTEIYHDYMKLPPEEKRRIHCDSVFMRS